MALFIIVSLHARTPVTVHSPGLHPPTHVVTRVSSHTGGQSGRVSECAAAAEHGARAIDFATGNGFGGGTAQTPLAVA